MTKEGPYKSQCCKQQNDQRKRLTNEWKQDWMRWEEDQVSHRQIFQLQLSYCIVRFHIFWDQSKSEICVFKDSLPLLSLRPILSTLYLYVHTHFFIITTQNKPHTHNPCTHSICMLEALQADIQSESVYPWGRYSYCVCFSHRAFLYNAIQHHNPSAALLPHHLPEMTTGVW